MFTRRSFVRALAASLSAAWIFCTAAATVAAPPGSRVPANLGQGLAGIVEWHQTNAELNAATTDAAGRAAAIREHLRQTQPRAQIEAATGRVIVEFILDGRATPAQVRAKLLALGVEVFAEHPATGGSGAAFGRLSARLPLERAVEAAALPGVHSIVLAHRPFRRVGKVTSQGLGVLRQDAVLARGFTGAGIKIGVISDSFDLKSPHAAADVASDDLPGLGNPAGRTTPVTVLAEGDPGDDSNIDEGRGMLQIIHDLAPDATLAFATAGPTVTTFANAVRSLRVDPNGRCDVLCDDIGFFNEPFFSDGIVAQACDDVINRADLPGRPMLFYTAGGNDGGLGYEAEFNPISDAAARAGTGRGNLKLDNVPTVLTEGGWHNFGAGTPVTTIGQFLTVSDDDTFLIFQWDDPFIPGKISADYNILVFDSSGNYLDATSNQFSGIDDNVAIGEAVEIAFLQLGANGRSKTYQVAITRRATSNPNPARRLRYVASTNGSISGTYLNSKMATLYGHVGARGIDAVGAYNYTAPSKPEAFSGLGPITIYLDAAGNRLAQPETRLQPTISATDGVDTTFFPSGSDNDTDQPPNGFPNFFGTSAAAPHVAAVAATLLQAGGGPGSLTSTRMRDIFESTATRYSADPDITSSGYSRAAGFGLLNAQAALNGIGHPAFFNGEVALSNGVYYLAFANGNVFGYYTYAFFPYLYHFDLGFEYFFDANDSARGAYLYDFASNTFFYTSPSFPFPYLYDFKLNAFLYYFPDTNNPGRYTQNPRFFYNFATGQIIMK